jgi:hypothetical protein
MPLQDALAFADADWASVKSAVEFVQDTQLPQGRYVYYGADWTHTDDELPIIKDSGQGAVTPNNMHAKNQDGQSNDSVGLFILTPIALRFKQDEFDAGELGVGIYVVMQMGYFGDDKIYWRMERLRGPAVFNDTPWAELIIDPVE